MNEKFADGKLIRCTRRTITAIIKKGVFSIEANRVIAATAKP